MKNSIICSNCKSENPLYEFACKKCKSYLRDRIYNIDIGKVLVRLIESPASSFRLIIFSEHKNFIIFLFLLLILKLEIDFIFISLFYNSYALALNDFVGTFLALAIFFVLFFLIFSYLLNIVNKRLGYITRTKDNFSILLYSFVPYVFALLILFPLELVMFGEYLFSTNPSPFILKEFAAYFFLVLELLVILWSFFLTIVANYTQTKNLMYSILIALIFHSLIFSFLYSFSKII